MFNFKGLTPCSISKLNRKVSASVFIDNKNLTLVAKTFILFTKSFVLFAKSLTLVAKSSSLITEHYINMTNRNSTIAYTE